MNIDVKNVTLNFPNMKIFPSYIEALQEGYAIGIQKPATPEEIVAIQNNPQVHLESLNEEKTGTWDAPDGSVFSFVPYEHLWLTHQNIFIGSVSFRHELNDFLKGFAGHIGYGIRPLLKGKGYGTLALKLTRKRAFSMGIDRLLVTCSPDNPASEKVILNNGGEFLDISPYTYGFEQITKRYWVNTKTD